MYIYVKDFDGKEHELEYVEGWRLMEVIRDWELPIKAECGGCCSCATCHVYVDKEWIDTIDPIEGEEEERLDEAFEVNSLSRLSCQIILTAVHDGLKVSLAPGSQLD